MLSTHWLDANNWYLWTMVPLLCVAAAIYCVRFLGHAPSLSVALWFNPGSLGAAYLLACLPLLVIGFAAALYLTYTVLGALRRSK